MTGDRVRTFGAALLCAAAMLTATSSSAQSQGPQGWPEPAASVVAAKPKPTPKARPARPKTIPVVETVAAAAEAPVPVAIKAVDAPPVTADLPQLLQQQSELLARLAAEIERQQALMTAQQEKIAALETRNAGAAPVLPAKPVVMVMPPPPPPPPPTITVETGGIKLKMSGLFQGWYTTSTNGVDTFRLRRTELKFSGEMSARAKLTLMVDAVKPLALQDAFATVVFSPSFIVDVGQQKIPLSLEGVQSSGKLETLERALFMTDKARGGGYGDVRDLGLMVRGTTAHRRLDYFGGLFNGLGESQNDVDKNKQKVVAFRAVARPAFLKGLQLGGSFARDGVAELGTTGRQRQGVEGLFTRPAYSLKGELMGGRDGAITRRGGYFQITRQLLKSVTGVARFDAWDPDTRSENGAAVVTERDWLGGVTYTIAKSGVWLQLNYVRKTFGDGLSARNVFMTNLQSTW